MFLSDEFWEGDQVHQIQMQPGGAPGSRAGGVPNEEFQSAKAGGGTDRNEKIVSKLH